MCQGAKYDPGEGLKGTKTLENPSYLHRFRESRRADSNR
jgi:hypothetical protein